MSDYRGPAEIGHFTVPGRGTTYNADFEGHRVQVYVTEKRKRIRVFVSGVEWRPVTGTQERGGTDDPSFDREVRS